MKNIKRILIKMLILILNLVYLILKIKKIEKNKVVMISRQSNEMSIDFMMLKKELENQNFNVVVLTKMIENGMVNKIKYAFYIFKIMFELSNSKVCIVDTYSIPVSILKQKKELIVIQIWHALGAVKKFGYQVVGNKEGSSKEIVEVFKMHKNYTYITCASEETKKIYTEAFDVEDSKVKVVGMPRVDYIKDLENNFNKEIYTDYPNLKLKKNIVYVPTFRKNQILDYSKFISSFNEEEFNIVVRPHPLDNTKIDEKYLIENKYNTYDLLHIADYIITDYSAISIEAAILNKPIYFYFFDIDSYKENRGLNINLFDEMKNATFTESSKINENIVNGEYNFEELKKFKEKYIQTININNTREIVKLVKGEDAI